MSGFCSVDEIILSTKQIFLDPYKNAFNPSLFKYKDGYLLSFRYLDEMDPSLSYIGIVLLDDSFEKITKPQLLSTRIKNSFIPSHSEDARIFAFRNRIFLIYNDCIDEDTTFVTNRRDMFIAELLTTGGQFRLSSPMKLISLKHYNGQRWQKNWTPFVWDNTLLLTYSLVPHQILYTNLLTGECAPYCSTNANIDWEYGILRGSAPPQMVDGEYLAFFHSGTEIFPRNPNEQQLWCYFMGAYTFSSEPPFYITHFSPKPITTEGFYVPSDTPKKVIFPGGYVISGSTIYLAYGKDDCEVWIAVLDYRALKKSLVPVDSL